MSIYHKTWAADEEITSDSLNQMARDADNVLDNIHPQLYGNAFLFWITGRRMTAALNNISGSKVITKIRGSLGEKHAFAYALDYAAVESYHSFRILSEMQKTKLRISWMEIIATVGSGPFNTVTAEYRVVKNESTTLATASHTITATSETAYTPSDVDISGCSAGDIITVEIIVDVATTNLPTNNNDGDAGTIRKISITLED